MIYWKDILIIRRLVHKIKKIEIGLSFEKLKDELLAKISFNKKIADFQGKSTFLCTHKT